MRIVSDGAAVPGHDSAGPVDSFVGSLACGFVALVGSAALVASADSVGRALELLFVFVVLVCLQAAAYAEGIRPWLMGEPVPLRGQVLQFVVIGLLLATFAGGLRLTGVAFCALGAGVFLPHAAALRFRRVKRELGEKGETWLAEEDSSEAANRVLTGDPEGHLTSDATPAAASAASAAPTAEDSQETAALAERPARARPAPKVGRFLRAAVNEERDRGLAWAAAIFAVTVGLVAAHVSGQVILGVDFLGVAALAWATRRLLGARLALRDFEEALTEPRRAYVVLLRDPSPRGTRPLLGVWAKEPKLAGGRLPRADAVYRCDAKLDALFSTRGAVIVHQAWVDTGPRAGSRPRWVAADAGVALPRQRAILGTQHLDSVIGTERPPRSRSLSMPAPNPTTETETGTFVTVISEPVPETRHFLALFAWRVVTLAGAALVLVWAGG